MSNQFFSLLYFTHHFIIKDDESHFHEAIDDWRQLNLSPAFLRFANKADLLSLSMPLLLHNWREIVELWLSALEDADDEALKALLESVQLSSCSAGCILIVTILQSFAKTSP